MSIYAYEQWAEAIGFKPLDNIYLYDIKEDMNNQLTYNLIDKIDTLYDLKQLNGKATYMIDLRYYNGNVNS